MSRIAVARKAPTFACLAAALVLLLAGGVAAQPAEPAAGGAKEAPTTAADVAIGESGTVELHVQGADIRQVLKLLSTPRKINIVATKEVQGTVTADLYGVTFEEALDAVLTSAGFVYVRKGSFVYVYTPKQLATIQAAQRPLSVRVFRLSYVTAADAKTLIAAAMSKDGTVTMTPAAATGIAATSDSSGGNANANEDVLVVRDYPENLEKIAAMLNDLDVRPQQVLIEATILRATLEEDNALGIDFAALAGVDFRSLGSTSDGLADVSAGTVAGAGLDKSKAAFRTDFNAGIPDGGLSIGFLSNNFGFFVRALESVTDVAVLANPKLLVMNKQRGEVLVGNRDGYLTTNITETSTTQTVEFIETGTKLLVRPYIASDGYIRLEIHPADSTGGVSVDQLPFEQTTECTSNVLIKDGHTMVIGGLFRERTSNGRAQVPGLGSIPLAGALFRRRVEETRREEVIILLTPHIVKTPVDAEVAEQLKDDVERFRLGLRQGLMWFGRERLAQTRMRWARTQLARGNEKRALWDVKMALSLEPRMESALRLKEQLTNQAIWAHESRYSSVHYVLQQMIMQEMGRPVEEVIPRHKPRDGMSLDPEVREALGIGPRPELPLEKPEEPKPVLPGQEEPPAAPTESQPSSAAPEGEQPDAAVTEEQPAAAAPEAEQPAAAAPETEQPAAAAPEGEQPAAAAPANEEPAAEAPEGEQPAAAEPEEQQTPAAAPEQERPSEPASEEEAPVASI